jgi:DNA-binding NarL/FixJ family response regulator
MKQQPQRTSLEQKWMKKRIMLVDDHLAFRQMMARVLSAEQIYEIVGEADDGFLALEICKRNTPEVVVLELVLPGLYGKEVLRRIRTRFPQVRVLVFSDTQNRMLILEALRCRPHGFVDKRESLNTFLDALRAVSAGRLYFSSCTAEFHSESLGGNSSRLTPRELEVLQLVAESRSSKDIASRLGLAPKTVENHRAKVMEKLNLHSVAALTRFAVTQGIVS